MDLLLVYLDQALEKMEADLKVIKNKVDYYIHVDIEDKKHISDWLRINKEDPEHLQRLTTQQVDLEFAIREMRNILYLRKRDLHR